MTSKILRGARALGARNTRERLFNLGVMLAIVFGGIAYLQAAGAERQELSTTNTQASCERGNLLRAAQLRDDQDTVAAGATADRRARGRTALAVDARLFALLDCKASYRPGKPPRTVKLPPSIQSQFVDVLRTGSVPVVERRGGQLVVRSG